MKTAIIMIFIPFGNKEINFFVATNWSLVRCATANLIADRDPPPPPCAVQVAQLCPPLWTYGNRTKRSTIF